MFKIKMIDGTEFTVASQMNMESLIDGLNDSYQDSMEWMGFVKDDGKKIAVRIIQIEQIMEIF